MRRSPLKLVMYGLVLAAVYYAIAVQAPAGPRSLRAFQPDRTARLEVEMWQAYYRQEDLKLFMKLVVLLREQYRFPWARAVAAAFYLARAAATFEELRSDYEEVLPDLEQGYRITGNWTRASFDPAAVAKAELSWWVARRTRGRNSPAEVGARMADEYALIYDVPRPRVVYAATLRAQAAALRDEGQAAADWPEVTRLLVESYRVLHSNVGLPAS